MDNCIIISDRMDCMSGYLYGDVACERCYYHRDVQARAYIAALMYLLSL